MKKKIAITGGIGSGKSTVLRMLQNAGYPCFSCDDIYNAIILDAEYIQKIQAEFPSAVIEGKIDRQRLSDIVFFDPDRRKKLNSIAHGQIMQRLFECMDKCTQDLVFAEVPLLFEGNYQNRFDGVIVVMRDNEARMQSVCARDNSGKDKVQARIAAQYDYSQIQNDAKRMQVPLYLIQNNATIEEIQVHLINIVKHIS